MGLPAIESNGRSQNTEALYLAHGAAVARFCRSLLRDRAEAEDAAPSFGDWATAVGCGLY